MILVTTDDNLDALARALIHASDDVPVHSLVGCAKCQRGYRARDLNDDWLCPQCAEDQE